MHINQGDPFLAPGWEVDPAGGPNTAPAVSVTPTTPIVENDIALYGVGDSFTADVAITDPDGK